MQSEGIDFHVITSRAKTVESYVKKAQKIDDGKVRYSDPLNEVTDLSGVRVICYNSRDVGRVNDFIRGAFSNQEDRDVGDERYRQGKFGYQSHHFLALLKPNRLVLPDFREYEGEVCEIQVRTVLQHAWAAIEHRVEYKSSRAGNEERAQLFTALAGLISVADRQFQSIIDEEENLKREQLESDKSDMLQDLEPEHPTEQSSKGQIKALLDSEDYEAAIAAYDEKIQEGPNAHSLYIGRSQAKHFVGNFHGALDDIAKALKLNSGDDVARRVLAKILFREFELSEPRTDAIKARFKHAELSSQGFFALSAGDADTAETLFKTAQALGNPDVFSKINFCCVNILRAKIRNARGCLTGLRIMIGKPMSITISALHCIIDIMEIGATRDENLDEFRNAVDSVEEFDMSIGPLGSLEKGIEINFPREIEAISLVFVAIRSKFEPPVLPFFDGPAASAGLGGPNSQLD